MKKIKYELIVVDSEADWFDTAEEYLESTEKIVEIKFYDIESLRKWWEILLMDYEGMNYCVYDCEAGQVIASGTYDPNDIENLFADNDSVHYLYSYPLEFKESCSAEVSDDKAGQNCILQDTDLKQTVIDILDVFDEFLDSRGIKVPCECALEENERNSDDNAAAIYGTEYYYSDECITRILSDFIPNSNKILLLAANNTDKEIMVSAYEDMQAAFDAMATDYRRVLDIIGENHECDINDKCASVFGTSSADLYYWNIVVI